MFRAASDAAKKETLEELIKVQQENANLQKELARLEEKNKALELMDQTLLKEYSSLKARMEVLEASQARVEPMLELFWDDRRRIALRCLQDCFKEKLAERLLAQAAASQQTLPRVEAMRQEMISQKMRQQVANRLCLPFVLMSAQ